MAGLLPTGSSNQDCASKLHLQPPRLMLEGRVVHAFTGGSRCILKCGQVALLAVAFYSTGCCGRRPQCAPPVDWLHRRSGNERDGDTRNETVSGLIGDPVCWRIEKRRILCKRASFMGVQPCDSNLRLRLSRSVKYPTSSITPKFTEHAGRPRECR